MRVRRWLGGVALVTPFVLGTAAADQPPAGEVAFVMADPEIVESSGLVVVERPDPGPGPVVVTVNDSGDTGRVFVVDPDTGATVGVTNWPDAPRDIEALAPAGRGHVWVGDIGDNRHTREDVEVRRVPVGRVDQVATDPAITFTYPDGPRDAEALLAHPGTGQLLVVTKGVFGGEVYAAPLDLDSGRENRLTRLGPVGGLVTDGAFWPDGRHLVLRTYDRAYFYTFPDLHRIAEIELPSQPQGEGIAVSVDGGLLVSTEGVSSEVLSVPLPAEVSRLLATPTNWWRYLIGLLLPWV